MPGVQNCQSSHSSSCEAIFNFGQMIDKQSDNFEGSLSQLLVASGEKDKKA
jgi:hypothetical protein